MSSEMFLMGRNRSQDSCGSNWSNSSREKEDKLSEVDMDIEGKHEDCHLNLQAEHEAFLQAFEKPTQIYRFLRTRQLISPVFLHRTLTYMRHRMSKNRRNSNHKRNDYKVDSILQMMIDKRKNEEQAQEASGNLVLRFTGIYDQNLDVERMTLEMSLLKLCHKKRKDVTAPMMQLLVGKSEVKVNPKDGDSTEEAVIVIPKSHFPISNGHQVKSYSLVFHATYSLPNGCVQMHNALENIENDTDELSSIKRRRIHEDVAYFKAELVIYDKHQRCLLTDADYQVVLQECPPPKSFNLFHRNKLSSWETCTYHECDFLDQNSKLGHGLVDVFRKGPVLGFHLSWSRSQSATLTVAKPSSYNAFFNWFAKFRNKKETVNDEADEKNSDTLDVSNSNDDNSKTSCSQVSIGSPKKPQRIIYQFLFNNNTRQQTKPRDDYHCPWCSLNAINLYSLLKHLKLCHSRFTFTYVPHTKGARIDVAINECFDGSYAGNPHDLSYSNTGFAFSRIGPVRRTPVTHVIVCRPKRFQASLSEFLEPDDDDGPTGRTCVAGHNRLYYHTTTCLPIRPQEMDYDSEAENDPEWMKIKTQMMIDEFTDVNEGEKEVMKLWNLHIMKHGFVGDCQIPLACMMFVEELGLDIMKRNLYKNFVLHITNLFDFGLLNASSMIGILKKYHKLNEEKRIKKEPPDLS